MISKRNWVEIRVKSIDDWMDLRPGKQRGDFPLLQPAPLRYYSFQKSTSCSRNLTEKCSCSRNWPADETFPLSPSPSPPPLLLLPPPPPVCPSFPLQFESKLEIYRFISYSSFLIDSESGGNDWNSTSNSNWIASDISPIDQKSDQKRTRHLKKKNNKKPKRKTHFKLVLNSVRDRPNNHPKLVSRIQLKIHF